MPTRNSHARTSTNHISTMHNGILFMFVLGDMTYKSTLYSTRKKLLEGEIEIPKFDTSVKSILVTCTKGEAPKFERL